MIFLLISSYLQEAHTEGERFPKTRALINESNRPALNLCFKEAAWVRVDMTYFMNSSLHAFSPRHRPNKQVWWEPELGQENSPGMDVSLDSLEFRITQKFQVTLFRHCLYLRDIIHEDLRGKHSCCWFSLHLTPDVLTKKKYTYKREMRQSQRQTTQ